MEQEFLLLLLSVISAVIGYLIEKYNLTRFRKPAEVFIKSLEDGKITKEEWESVLKAISDADDVGKAV